MLVFQFPEVCKEAKKLGGRGIDGGAGGGGGVGVGVLIFHTGYLKIFYSSFFSLEPFPLPSHNQILARKFYPTFHVVTSYAAYSPPS